MLVITFKLVNHYSKDPRYMHPWCGYRVRVNAAVLSMYRHATDVAMLPLVAHSMEQVCAHSYQSKCAIIYYVQHGASVCTLLPIHNLLCTVSMEHVCAHSYQ